VSAVEAAQAILTRAERNHYSNGLEFAVSATSSNPHEYARRGGDAKHPVLARLPDVSSETSSSHRTDHETRSDEYVDYRFDAPAGTVEKAAAAMRRITQPHTFQRAPQSERRLRARRAASKVLPDSDPFSIPSSSLIDRFAPVAQFLMMFAFFTAAGTAFLMMRGRTTSSGEDKMQRVSPPPIQAPVSQKLVPAAAKVETAVKDSTTASGPLGADDNSEIEHMFARSSKQEDSAPSTAAQGQSADDFRIANNAQIQDKPALPKVQTSEPYVVGGVGYESKTPDGSGIPARSHAFATSSTQVERLNSAPPIARLPGFIFESPPRQAQHDNHQPGLH